MTTTWPTEADRWAEAKAIDAVVDRQGSFGEAAGRGEFRLHLHRPGGGRVTVVALRFHDLAGNLRRVQAARRLGSLR